MAIDDIVGQALFLAVAGLAGLVLARVTRLDTSLACVVAGVLFGLLPAWLNFDSGIRTSNVQSLVFYVFIPILIFEAAWHLKPSLMWKWLLPSLLLATLGVVVSALVVALLAFLGINHGASFPVIAALLTGAIVAATDPVAVVAQLKVRKCPEDLVTLVESESLYNDATAIVLFTLVLAFALGETTGSALDIGTDFARSFIGGGLVGVGTGLAAALLARLLGSMATTNCVLLVTAFGSFWIGQHVFGVSGIVTVMLAAITARLMLHNYERRLMPGGSVTWEWLSTLFNSVLFALMGLVITFDMFAQQWLAMLIAVPTGLLARAAAVYLSCSLSALFGKPVNWAWQHLLVWGGLRGGIAIALVLAIPTSLPYWLTVQSMVFAMVLFSLVFAGPTIGTLLHRLGITDAQAPAQRAKAS